MIDIKQQPPDDDTYVICNVRKINTDGTVNNFTGHYKHFEDLNFMSVFHLHRPQTCWLITNVKNEHGEFITHWQPFPEPIEE